jgi:beta-lactam-binding protein with PASTA domain
VTTPPPPPEDAWSEPDAPTVVQQDAAYGGPPPGPPPDRRIGSGMLLALGAIALVALGFLIVWLLTHRHHHHAPPTTVVITTAPTTNRTAGIVPVPDVRGVQAPHAASVLQSVGLKARTTTVAAAGKPAGSVVSESPAPGAKVTKGSEVLLSVAQGTPKPQTATAQTTTAQTTTAQTTTAQPTTTQAAPPPQPTTSTVPDLSGQNEASAAQALGQAGLLASLVFVPSSDELGTVEAQAKPAGTKLPYHSHVQVNISTGPGNKPMEQVPNVVGKTLQQALAAINAAHLRLIYLKYPVTAKAQAGKVVQQSPLGGQRAPQNAQVVVYLAAFKG